MKITPDGAQKRIRSLEEERQQLVEEINQLSTFVVAVSEGDPEELRPEFNFFAAAEEIRKIDEQIRKVKHARNVFNVETVLPGETITVDEALVWMAMLNKNYEYYVKFGNRQQKERSRTGFNKEIEYVYTNYDIQEVRQYGKTMYAKLLEIQSKINLINSTYYFEVEL